MKIYVTISFNKTLPDNEGFSLSKVIDESVEFLKLKKINNINYKVISRHKEKLYNNRYYHYINPDNYFVNILSIILKVFINKSLLKHYFDSSSRDNIKYTLALVFFILLKINKSDLILFHGSYKVLYLFSMIFPNYNFIYYRHGGNFNNIASKTLNDIISFCKGRIIHVSKSTYDQLKIDKDKSIIIHNGLKDSDFQKFRLNRITTRNHIRKKYNLDKRTLVYFMGGIIWEPKGYHIAINAISKLNDSSVVLFIAGDTKNIDQKYFSQLNQLSEKKGVKTIFLGRLKKESLYHVIVASDIGLQLTIPNKYEEGIPIILLEMMFLGLPIICTNSGGNIEIVKNNYSGIIVRGKELNVPLTSALNKLNNINVRKEMGKNALNTAKQHFSSKNMTEKLIHYLYQQSVCH